MLAITITIQRGKILPKSAFSLRVRGARRLLVFVIWNKPKNKAFLKAIFVPWYIEIVSEKYIFAKTCYCFTTYKKFSLGNIEKLYTKPCVRKGSLRVIYSINNSERHASTINCTPCLDQIQSSKKLLSTWLHTMRLHSGEEQSFQLHISELWKYSQIRSRVLSATFDLPWRSKIKTRQLLTWLSFLGIHVFLF